jgi:hypothetical protein
MEPLDFTIENIQEEKNKEQSLFAELPEMQNPSETKSSKQHRLPNSLTLKQENFCREFINSGGNRTLAYRRTHNCQNSTDKTVKENASRLYSQHKIRSRIIELKKELGNKLDYTALENLRNLEFSQKITLGLDPDEEIPDFEIMRVFKNKRNGLEKIDLSAFLKAEELKAKLTGLYKDKIEFTGGTNLSFDVITPKEEKEVKSLLINWEKV